MEHGSFSMESVADILVAARGADIIPLVGPSTIEAYMISRALDAGAMGVIAPHVETREEVELIVQATKYPPLGERGLATRGGHLDYRKGYAAQDIIQTINRETLIVLKVESGQAIDRLEELITVISARGEVSNLQVMKDMLDTATKLRRGISRALEAGQSCESYLDSSKAGPYRIYGNFYPYAGQLCKELSEEKQSTVNSE